MTNGTQPDRPNDLGDPAVDPASDRGDDLRPSAPADRVDDAPVTLVEALSDEALADEEPEARCAACGDAESSPSTSTHEPVVTALRSASLKPSLPNTTCRSRNELPSFS